MEKWEEQVEMCLDAAFAVSKPWDGGVRAVIKKDREKTFRDHVDDFENAKADVLHGSELAGKVARLCADIEGRPNVSKDDMLAGIAAAHHVCHARFRVKGDPKKLFFLWCEGG